jgi:hypothetical protein
MSLNATFVLYLGLLLILLVSGSSTVLGQQNQTSILSIPEAAEGMVTACIAFFDHRDVLGKLLPMCDHDLLYFKGLCEKTSNTEKYCFNFD